MTETHLQIYTLIMGLAALGFCVGAGVDFAKGRTRIGWVELVAGAILFETILWVYSR
jgi:hypothetical protein